MSSSIVTFARLSQLANTPEPHARTCAPIWTEVSAVQPSKAPGPTFSTDAGRITLLSAVQFLNALYEICSTELGISILVSVSFPENASSPMLETVSGTLTKVSVPRYFVNVVPFMRNLSSSAAATPPIPWATVTSTRIPSTATLVIAICILFIVAPFPLSHIYAALKFLRFRPSLVTNSKIEIHAIPIAANHFG